MPNVRGGGQTHQGGYHTSGQIKKTMKPDYARDDIDVAFAGEENNGPAGKQKITEKHDTHLKSRKTKHNADKTPIK